MAEDDAVVGFLFGAKRRTETLVHRIAVHPDHLRRGHGRHMLDSLRSKLSILGPPRIVAEVPSGRADALALFEAAGYERETTFDTWRLDGNERARFTPAGPAGDRSAGLVVPMPLEDLAANGVLADRPGLPWERSLTTLRARAASLRGLALVADDAIAAALLWSNDASGPGAVVSDLRLDVRDPGAARANLGRLLGALAETAAGPLLLKSVAAGEVPSAWLEAYGLARVGTSVRVSTRAGSA